MPTIHTVDDLIKLRSAAQAELAKNHHKETTILIGMGTCGTAAGASDVAAAIRKELSDRNIEARIIGVGCIGFCAGEPLVDILLPGEPRITYANVKPAMASRLVEEHIVNGKVVDKWVMAQMPINGSALKEGIKPYAEHPFYSKQVRIALRNCGMIDPEEINEYITADGYQALAKVVTEMTPDQVIEEMKRSGLRGRGGAGFMTGVKWDFCRKAKGAPKYVICNADEGDPGAFMDRSVIEGDPHSLLEGMTIAGYAIGASQGYIYCRAEYPLAIGRLKRAIAQAHENNLLGNDILGTGFSFDLKVKEGAGAFVCGEETALIHSIEGKRGEPSPRPPFPAVSGLWNKPSNVNNVKSYAMTPQILLRGAEWFRGIGTKTSTGTAVFALTGNIKNTGLIEVPMGITLREIIYDVGGGIPKKKKFKAVQTGGPLGGCIPESALDTPVDFDSLTQAGATMGSGGMIVIDQDTCMVEFARYFLTFASAESCGKCPPCRIGGQRLLEILTRIGNGDGKLEDLEEIRRISKGMQTASLCALGQLTPGPVLSALNFFIDEYEAHIKDHFCQAGICSGMFTYDIIEQMCTGCGLCLRACPREAIAGEKKKPHLLDQIKCIQCGACYQACKFEAVTIKPKF